MKDWASRLDDFLKMSGSDILTHAGKISHRIAKEKAEIEYAKYKHKEINELSKVEKDFIASIDQAEKVIKRLK